MTPEPEHPHCRLCGQEATAAGGRGWWAACLHAHASCWVETERES